MDRKKINLILIALFLCAQSFARTQDGWVLQKQEAGIEVYTRDGSDPDFKEFKGIARIRGARLSSLVAAFDDTSSYTKWMHACIGAELLQKKNLFERYTYIVLHAPWPISDRDSFVYAMVGQDKKTLAVTITIIARPDSLPRKKNRVRIPRMNTRWVFQPSETGVITVTYESDSDPGGILPAALANMAAVDIPYYTLLRLQDLIKEQKYAEARYPEIQEPRGK